MKTIEKEKGPQGDPKNTGAASYKKELKTDTPLSEKDQVKEAEEKVRKGLKK